MIKCRVFRYDPSTDAAPTYKMYDVPWREHITVLEALRYIYENYEPIAFEYSCRSARCGTCAVKVNGKMVLACITMLKAGSVTIEPLDNFDVVRDLVVDRSKINSKIMMTKPWLLRSEPLDVIPDIPYDVFEKIMRLQYCFDCQICYSACPTAKEASSKYAGPHTMVKIAMRFYDPRDEGAAERLRISVNEGLFDCLLCGTCKEVCPVGRTLDPLEIDHLTVLKDLRKGVVENRMAPSAIMKMEENMLKRKNVFGLRPRVSSAAGIAQSMKVEKKAEIVYFVGCTARYLSRAREQVSAITSILNYTNEDWTNLPDERCCGHPLILGGTTTSFEDFVQHNLKAIEATDATTVITGCPACRQTMLEDYSQILGKRPPFKVMHISEYLHQIIKEGKLPKHLHDYNGSITYHDPCMLGRIGDVLEEPRHVLTFFSEKLVEPRQTGREGLCCGYGGLLNATNYKLSDTIADKTFNELAKTGSAVIVTACPTCEIAMKNAASRRHDFPDVLDISKFVATQLRL